MGLELKPRGWAAWAYWRKSLCTYKPFFSLPPLTLTSRAPFSLPIIAPHQALIRQWEYQPIRRRVENGAYCHRQNREDDEEDRLAGLPDLSPRVMSAPAPELKSATAARARSCPAAPS